MPALANELKLELFDCTQIGEYLDQKKIVEQIDKGMRFVVAMSREISEAVVLGYRFHRLAFEFVLFVLFLLLFELPQVCLLANFNRVFIVVVSHTFLFNNHRFFAVLSQFGVTQCCMSSVVDCILRLAVVYTFFNITSW